MKKIITRKDGSISVVTINNEPSRTIQDFKDEVDVNNIIDRFTKTGQLSHISQTPLVYKDSTELPADLQGSISFIKQVEEKYEQLSKKMKKQFKSVQEFYSYVTDPNNKNALSDLFPQKNNDSNDDKKPEEQKPEQK